MLTHTQEQFLTLLRAGLWDHVADTTDLHDIDWKAIYTIADEQTVVGLVADAIGKLPDTVMPAIEEKVDFILDKPNIEKSHLKLNKRARQVVQFLNEHEIPSVLLKGQGVAQNYIHPTSRTCGDIDLYVGKKNYEKTIALLKPLSDDPDAPLEETVKHASFDLAEVHVEIHKMVSTLDSRKRDDFLQAWRSPIT